MGLQFHTLSTTRDAGRNALLWGWAGPHVPSHTQPFAAEKVPEDGAARFPLLVSPSTAPRRADLLRARHLGTDRALAPLRAAYSQTGAVWPKKAEEF